MGTLPEPMALIAFGFWIQNASKAAEGAWERSCRRAAAAFFHPPTAANDCRICGVAVLPNPPILRI
jgi:hypothetical protein